MLLGVLLALPSGRPATFPWEACGDWLGPVWFVVAHPDTGHGRTYGTFRCQSLSFGPLPCRAALAAP